MAAQPQQYCLKWNSFHSNMSDVFQNMLIHENLVDCTVACDGASIKAHKMVLAACSPYFQNLFISNPCKHPIIILKDVKFCDLKSIIDFIYRGEVNVPQNQLNTLLKTAETLKIKGLAEVGDKQSKGQQIMQSVGFRQKKRKRNRNKSSLNQQNTESVDSSEEEENISNKSRNENNLSPYYIGSNSVTNYRTYSQRQSFAENTTGNSLNINRDKDRTLNVGYIEPTKLLEQSMSTPENTGVDYSNAGILTIPTNHQLNSDTNNDVNEIVLVEDEYSSNSNQCYDGSIRPLSQIGSNSNHATPQTIEEYEQLLAEIQMKNLTTCPVCSKEFIKKSKLVRHYHTHFSNFRPKFSCGSCGKLFTTQDWCKRHAINCQNKVAQIGFL